jgi:hypothetical protein
LIFGGSVVGVVGEVVVVGAVVEVVVAAVVDVVAELEPVVVGPGTVVEVVVVVTRGPRSPRVAPRTGRNES